MKFAAWRTRLMGVAGLAIGLLAACGGPAPTRPAVEIHDSGGITVVVNPPDRIWSDETGWALQEVWRVGDGPLEFGRIVGLEPLSDGSLVVLDGLPRELIILGPDGGETARVGRAGQGPGELGLILPGIFADGEDVIHVPDTQNRRVNQFSADGRVLEAAPLRPLAGGWVRFEARGPDGDALGQALTPDGERLMQLSAGLDSPSVVFDFVAAAPLGPDRVDPFAARPVWASLSGGRIAVAYSNELRIEILDPDDTITRVICGPSGRVAIPPEAEKEIQELWIQRSIQQGVQREVIALVIRDWEWILPEYMPALTSMFEGPEQTIWARRGPRFEDLDVRGLGAANLETLGGSEWDVFSADGAYLGSLHLPATLRFPVSIRDRIVGVIQGEFDEDIVVSFTLEGLAR